MKIIIVLLLSAIYCINAECPNCIADNCVDCTKSGECAWCNGGCLSKYAKILCETRIENSESCPAGLCAVTECIEGTTCVEKDGKAVCVENGQTTNPCAVTTCMEGTTCVEQDGKAVCVDNGQTTSSCAVILCPVNTVCKVVNGGAECVDPCASVRCASGTCVVNADGTTQCTTQEPCTGTDCPISKSISKCAAIDCIEGYYCDESTGDCVPSTCTYNGKTYTSGESFPSDDGCNQCGIYCTAPDNAEVYCTLMACMPLECDTNDKCDSGFYCEKATCNDDTQGYCKKLPEACLTMLDPVCGCDGNTYGNSCEAASKGVNVDHSGECECNGANNPDNLGSNEGTNSESSGCYSWSFYSYILSMIVILGIIF